MIIRLRFVADRHWTNTDAWTFLDQFHSFDLLLLQLDLLVGFCRRQRTGIDQWLFWEKKTLPSEAWLISSTMERTSETGWNANAHDLYLWLLLLPIVLLEWAVVSLECSWLRQHVSRDLDVLAVLSDVSLIPRVWRWWMCVEFSLLNRQGWSSRAKPINSAYRVLVNYWRLVDDVTDLILSLLPPIPDPLFSVPVAKRQRPMNSWRDRESYSYFLLETLCLIDDFLSSTWIRFVIIVQISGSTFPIRFVLVAVIVILLFVIVLIEVRIDEILLGVFRVIIIVFRFLKRTSSISNCRITMSNVSHQRSHRTRFHRIRLLDRPAGPAIALIDYQPFDDVRVQLQRTSVRLSESKDRNQWADDSSLSKSILQIRRPNNVSNTLLTPIVLCGGCSLGKVWNDNEAIAHSDWFIYKRRCVARSIFLRKIWWNSDKIPILKK